MLMFKKPAFQKRYYLTVYALRLPEVNGSKWEVRSEKCGTAWQTTGRPGFSHL